MMMVPHPNNYDDFAICGCWLRWPEKLLESLVNALLMGNIFFDIIFWFSGSWPPGISWSWPLASRHLLVLVPLPLLALSTPTFSHPSRSKCDFWPRAWGSRPWLFHTPLNQNATFDSEHGAQEHDFSYPSQTNMGPCTQSMGLQTMTFSHPT